MHVRYDPKLNKVMIACTDPDFDTILSLKRGQKPDRVARAMLVKYGKMPADAAGS